MEQVTAAQMKQIEQAANAGGLSYLTMMENAGRAAAELAKELWPDARTVAVFCGKGNNGGDGFVVAR
ncbi:NAD(P)H-hydrate epimerase, partial [uncultured Ruthenibacterium sp.]|uniref:NAD(P)H-hydrate epimerase n=1 Tax=uncultured Ruthenibacterium sp. TaxID=1905347 RepID=UPI00349E91B7